MEVLVEGCAGDAADEAADGEGESELHHGLGFDEVFEGAFVLIVGHGFNVSTVARERKAFPRSARRKTRSFATGVGVMPRYTGVSIIFT